RRLTGTALSAVPQIVSVDGGLADSPDIDIEDDGSFAWVVFRQDIAGASRSIGRRLVGSAFEAPEAIDGGLPSTAPERNVGGARRGWAVAQGPGATSVVGQWLDHDHFQPGGRIDGGESATPTKPEVAAADRGDLAIAWRNGTTAAARFKDADSLMGPQFTI